MQVGHTNINKSLLIVTLKNKARRCFALVQRSEEIYTVQQGFVCQKITDSAARGRAATLSR